MEVRGSIRSIGQPLPAFGAQLRRFWDAQVKRAALRRSRRALLNLSDAHLKDIGVTRDMARAEALRSNLTDH